MFAMSFLLAVSSPRPSRSRWVICRPEASDDAPASRARTADGGLSWLARNGRSPGEESPTGAVASRRSRCNRPSARSSPREAVWFACAQTASSEKNVTDIELRLQDDPGFKETKRNVGAQKGLCFFDIRKNNLRLWRRDQCHARRKRCCGRTKTKLAPPRSVRRSEIQRSIRR